MSKTSQTSRIKALLREHSITQSSVAQALHISPGTLADIVNHGEWPKRSNQDTRSRIVQHLIACGVPAAKAEHACQVNPQKVEPAPADTSAGSPSDQPSTNRKDTRMLRRKTNLTQAARAKFGLARDPFAEHLESADDVYLSPELRFVRESMYHTAKHGGMLAVIAESGAGKSVLRRDLHARIALANDDIVLVEPYVLAMEENIHRGKPMKALHISEAIMQSVAPGSRCFGSPEKTFRCMHAALKESTRAGTRHCLVIEEAHCLPVPLLKELKRFWELEEGFRRLLSIILIGQPELKDKLSERNPEVREVVQRCELVAIPPLDEHLEPYIRHRFARVGADSAKVFEKDTWDALRAKLSYQAPQADARGKTSIKTWSLCYPLHVHNVLAEAINFAAEHGAERVDGEIIKGV